MKMHNPPHPGELLKTLCLEPLELTVTEAARSLGLSQVAALRLVVLPQAIRTVIPPLGSITSALVRNSSIASAISARELLFMGLLVHQRTFSFEPFLGILVGYWSLTIPLAFAISQLERRLAYAR